VEAGQCFLAEGVQHDFQRVQHLLQLEEEGGAYDMFLGPQQDGLSTVEGGDTMIMAG